MKKYKKGQRLSRTDRAILVKQFSRLVGPPMVTAADFGPGKLEAAKDKILKERALEKAERKIFPSKNK